MFTSNRGRGSFALDVAGTFHPGAADTLFALASVARGNGLNNTAGVSLAPNADDLEDDVENINGRDRHYLLEAWYRRQILDDRTRSLAVTGGLIDATHYLDHNRVANDEISQFMNEALVNRFFVPSYDPGIAVQTQHANWHVDMVWMHTQTDTDKKGGVDYDFYGVDLGYVANLPFGEGHYHLVLQTTSNDFNDRDNSQKQTHISGVSVSLDQGISETVSLFVRAGKTNSDATALVHDLLYSAGVQLQGTSPALSRLVSGFALAYLDGAGNKPGDIRHTRLVEAYARHPLGRRGDISADVQWIADANRATPNARAWIVGTRLNLFF